MLNYLRKNDQVRYNPQLFRVLQDLKYANTIVEMLNVFDSLYGLPLKQQLQDANKRNKSWVDKSILYKVDLAFKEGNWFIFNRPLDYFGLNQKVLNDLTNFFHNLRKNETYLFEAENEDLFITQRDYIDDGHQVRGLTFSKIRFITQKYREMMN